MQKTLLILALLISGNCVAELHKWVDEKGKIHYSDTPPANVKTQKLRTSSAANDAVPSETAAGKSTAEKEAEYRKKQQDQQANAEKSAAEQEKSRVSQANCNAATQNLRNLQSGAPIVMVNESGERVPISDDERQVRMYEAQQNMEKYCR